MPFSESPRRRSSISFRRGRVRYLLERPVFLQRAVPHFRRRQTDNLNVIVFFFAGRLRRLWLRCTANLCSFAVHLEILREAPTIHPEQTRRRADQGRWLRTRKAAGVGGKCFGSRTLGSNTQIGSDTGEKGYPSCWDIIGTQELTLLIFNCIFKLFTRCP